MITRVAVSLGLVIVLCPTLLLGITNIQPVSTKEYDHPFVRYLESRYQEYLTAEKSGDIEKYKQLRPKEIIEFMEDNLRKRNKLQFFKERLIDLSQYSHELKTFRFYQCEVFDDAARLTYINDSPREVHIETLIILFHFQDNLWKVGKMIHTVEHSKEKTLDDVLQDAYAKFK